MIGLLHRKSVSNKSGNGEGLTTKVLLAFLTIVLSSALISWSRLSDQVQENKITCVALTTKLDSIETVVRRIEKKIDNGNKPPLAVP